MEKVPPIESVEASKAARLQRHQARYRDRGGIFKPPESNALLDILLSRNVNGESPSRPRPGPRKSKTPTAQRARARASIAPAPASRKKAARVPRKSVRKSAGRNDEDAAAQDRPRAKKAKARAKAKSVPDNDNDPQMQRSYAAQLADVINAGRPVPPKSKPRTKKQPTAQPADTNAATETNKAAQPRSTASPASDNAFPIESPQDVDLSKIDVVRVIVHRSPHKDFEPVLMSCTVDEIDPPSDLEPPKPKRGRLKKAAAGSTAGAKKPLSKTNMRLGEKSSGQSKSSSSKAPPRATAPEPEPEPAPLKGKEKEKAAPRSLSPIQEEGEEEPDVSQSVDVPLAKAVKGKRKADDEVGRGAKKRRWEVPAEEEDEKEDAIVPVREVATPMTKSRQVEVVEEAEAAPPPEKAKAKAAEKTKTKEKPAKASSSRLQDDGDGRKPVKKGSRAPKAQSLKVQEEDSPDDDDDIPIMQLPKKTKAKQGGRAKAQQKEKQPDDDDDDRAAEASKKAKGKAKEKQRLDAPDSDAERPGKRARDEAANDLKRGNKKSKIVFAEDDEEEEGPATPIKASKMHPDPKPHKGGDVFARVAKEATSAPAVKPIPSPIKKKPPTEKPLSKSAAKTRKPQSQRATTKPPSRGPPPSVLRLLAANAARSQIQASEASDDDPIDFLGGAE